MDVVAAPFPVTWDLNANVGCMERALAASAPGSLVAFLEGHCPATPTISRDLPRWTRLAWKPP